MRVAACVLTALLFFCIKKLLIELKSVDIYTHWVYNIIVTKVWQERSKHGE